MHGKLSGTVTAAAKARCWEEVVTQVSGVSGVPWEVEEVKKKWSCLKSEAKMTAAKARQSHQQTRCGPKSTVLCQVCDCK